MLQGRLGAAPPGSSAGGLPSLPAAPPSSRYSDLRPGDGSSEPERLIHDRIHRLYQSTEPAGQHKTEPPPAAASLRPAYPPADYPAPYYDHLKGVQMHPAKPPPPPPQVGGRHSPYLPAAPPGTSAAQDGPLRAEGRCQVALTSRSRWPTAGSRWRDSLGEHVTCGYLVAFVAL